MNINTHLRELGEIDISSLYAAISDLDDNAWLSNQNRQNDYEVHKQTQSVVMVFCDGPMNDLEVSKESGWDALADAAVPLMHDIIERCYEPGGTIIRAMAAKLLKNGRINPHFDKHQSFQCSHRIHVPITTNARVRFTIDGKPIKMQVGHAYEINNQMVHSVMNRGNDDRITFIFDYLPAKQPKSQPPT